MGCWQYQQIKEIRYLYALKGNDESYKHNFIGFVDFDIM
jgi:hypothetical protein